VLGLDYYTISLLATPRNANVVAAPKLITPPTPLLTWRTIAEALALSIVSLPLFQAKISQHLVSLRYILKVLSPTNARANKFLEQIQQTIEDHAGQVIDIAGDGTLNFDDITHIISTTSDFPQYSAAREHMIAVITPAWIAASLLRNKQAPIRPYTPDPKLFFNQVNVTCADIPTGDKDAIIGAVLAMGGMESSSLTKTTTHICALTMDHPKCQQAIERNLKAKIVLPHWYV
jgi:hypothetical protein